MALSSSSRSSVNGESEDEVTDVPEATTSRSNTTELSIPNFAKMDPLSVEVHHKTLQTSSKKLKDIVIFVCDQREYLSITDRCSFSGESAVTVEDR